jgi:hypothetical protein
MVLCNPNIGEIRYILGNTTTIKKNTLERNKFCDDTYGNLCRQWDNRSAGFLIWVIAFITCTTVAFVMSVEVLAFTAARIVCWTCTFVYVCIM